MPEARDVIPFGRYVLRERLAKGGMGEVFRAVAVGERGFEKPVVVKRILPEHARRSEMADLFVEEAMLMTRLAHPNVVEVLDFGRGEAGDYFLVLEFVDGADLGRISALMSARGEPFPLSLALYVATQALRGLHHAHTRAAEEGALLVHRDVSPSNLLLSVEGEVKVADFGVALVRRAGEHRRPTGVVGKPAYMAPEQYEGREIDARADIFAVGVVLFELATGSLPYEGATEEERQDAAKRGDFGRARDIRPEVTPELDAVLRRALAPSPDARFADAKAMARALGECGLPIATSDDAADAVRAALISLRSQGRRVIALSADAPRDEEPDVAGRELTRTAGAGFVSAFTLRVMEGGGDVRAGEPSTSAEGSAVAVGVDVRAPRESLRISTETASRVEEREAAGSVEGSSDGSSALISRSTPLNPARELEGRARSGRLGDRRFLLIGAVTAAGLAAFGLRWLTASKSDEPEPSLAPSSSASAPAHDRSSEPLNTIEVVPQPPTSEPSLELQPTLRSAPRSSSAPVSTSVSASVSAPVPVPAPVSVPVPAPVSASAPAPPSIATSSSPQPADDCTGTVKIASNGSYTVSGGPAVVQSPGVYTWRCGAYALSAVSRADPTQKKAASVVVRAGGSSIVDLR